MTDVMAASAPHAILHEPRVMLQPADHGAHLALDALSPVTQNGSFEFDRIIKAGEVRKRTRRTKAWKPIFIVLRPNLLSIYRDRAEAQLRHQIALDELTAVARQEDPKRKDRHVFALFLPSRTYHLKARSESEAQEWVDLIKREAHIDKDDDAAVYRASTAGGASASRSGEPRTNERSISPGQDDRGGYLSSDAEPPPHAAKPPVPAPYDTSAATTTDSAPLGSQQPPAADRGSYSDVSDIGRPSSAAPAAASAARTSVLSLTYTTDGRPSTSSNYLPPAAHGVYGHSPVRPALGARNASQASGLGMSHDSLKSAVAASDERVVYHSYVYLLKPRRGVRAWKKVWMVLRPKGLALYKNEEEYTATLILPFSSIVDVVEIDPISKRKTSCMQVITEERDYRFCAMDEEHLAHWLGAFKSLLSKRKASEVSPGVPPPTGPAGS